MRSELLAQGGLEDLAVVVFGYAVDKEVGSWPFVPCDGVEAQAVERLNRHRRLRTGHDEGDYLLAPVPVWAANDRHFQYPRVA